MAAKQPAFIPILTDVIGHRHSEIDHGLAPIEVEADATATVEIDAPAPAEGNTPAPAEGNTPAPAEGNTPAPAEGDMPAPPGSDAQNLIVELQTRIAAGAYDLTDEIVRCALAEMEATLYRRISGRLRQELPELIDSLLREQLERGQGA